MVLEDSADLCIFFIKEGSFGWSDSVWFNWHSKVFWIPGFSPFKKGLVVWEAYIYSFPGWMDRIFSILEVSLKAELPDE